jgi:hypothetical protein
MIQQAQSFRRNMKSSLQSVEICPESQRPCWLGRGWLLDAASDLVPAKRARLTRTDTRQHGVDEKAEQAAKV